MWSLAALFYCYQFLLRVSPGVMQDDWMEAFAINASGIGMLASSYYIAYTLMQLPIGIMMDNFGPRKLISIAVMICGLGAISFSYTDTYVLAIVSRFLIGMGAACGFLGCLKLGTLWFKGHQMGLISSLTTSLGTVGAMLGFKPLTLLNDQVGWRSSLLLIGIFGISLCLIIWSFVRDSPTEKIPEHNLAQDTQKLLTGLKKVVVNPQSWRIALIGMLLYVPLAGFADLWGVRFLMQQYEISESSAAGMITSIYIGVAVGGPFAAMLSDYARKRRLPMLVSAIATSILYFIILFITPPSQILMYGLLFLSGFFFSGQCLCFASACEITPLSMSGVAIGFTNMIVMLSGVIFQNLIGWLLEYQGHGEVIAGVFHYPVRDYQIALAPIFVSLACVMLILPFVKETHPFRANKIS